MTVAAIVLAAGGSQRMGSDKLVLRWRGRPVLTWVVEGAMGAGVDEVLVVVRPGSPAASLARRLGARTVENPDADRGLSTSLQAGLAALGRNVRAAVILLGDEPDVDPRLIGRLIGEVEAADAPAGRIRYEDRPGHPVVVTRACFAELMAVEGDMGAGALLTTLADRVELQVAAPAPRDLDRPEDLDRSRPPG